MKVMKVGDKLICIKDYITTPRGVKINSINKEYTIISINDFKIAESNLNDGDVIFGVSTDNGDYNQFWLKYQYFNDNWDDMRKDNLIYDFFITPQQYRKLKLQKINEESDIL